MFDVKHQLREPSPLMRLAASKAPSPAAAPAPSAISFFCPPYVSNVYGGALREPGASTLMLVTAASSASAALQARAAFQILMLLQIIPINETTCCGLTFVVTATALASMSSYRSNLSSLAMIGRFLCFRAYTRPRPVSLTGCYSSICAYTSSKLSVCVHIAVKVKEPEEAPTDEALVDQSLE